MEYNSQTHSNKMKFPHYLQLDQMDCGATCLRMISRFYGKKIPIEVIRQKTQTGKGGTSMLGIAEAAESLGFKTLGVSLTMDQILENAPLPCILHWEQNHFVVLYTVRKRKKFFFLGENIYTFLIADPEKGILLYSLNDVKKYWTKDSNKGLALLLQPKQDFFSAEYDKLKTTKFINIFSYFKNYKRSLLQIILGFFIGSFIQLILPFLTQSLVDVGVNDKNISFVYLLLFAQLMLMIGRFSIEIVRGWLILYISTRINLSILSNFISKLLLLPISFFDSKRFGDILQRLGDHSRIESFLTSHSINTLFSIFNLITFSIVLFIMNKYILSIFVLFSLLYILWILIFLKNRKQVNIQRFNESSKNQNAIVQLIHGMQEIKLSHAELYMKWGWEKIQSRLFKLQIRSLSLTQYQQAGSFFINELKNIILTFLSAKAVIDNELTLGGMLSIQYIIGQLNSPLDQLIAFIQSYQDAQISMARLDEINHLENEESSNSFLQNLILSKNIRLNNVSFKYKGAGNEHVLKSVTLNISSGKTTAIVGSSGSGKTTILKLLLKFYEDYEGIITLGDSNLTNLSHKLWRKKCGSVMQDGFIFSDTIARNISIGDEFIDIERILHAINMANLSNYIESLPMGLNTQIGANGNGLSQGQKQRILLARVIYKNPEYIFLDEATNALDAENELKIMNNLNKFLKGKTVVIVAHRLSTVKQADQIIVLEKGNIVECGTHVELVIKKGRYYELIKNQLELGI